MHVQESNAVDDDDTVLWPMQIWRLNFSQTARYNGLVSMEHPWCESNDHVTNDVTSPRRVLSVTKIHLSLNVSKSCNVSTNGAPIGNGMWQIWRSRDWSRMTSRDAEGQGRDLGMFKAVYIANSSRKCVCVNGPPTGNHMVRIESCGRWRQVT